MAGKHLLILERSAQNLQKITKNGKVMLEGVFAEFGVENRNGRIYEEKEYLPHLEYLKKDITNGNLLGELDHPERFEVALGGVSHRISELWYDQQKRQVLGRIEILDTPKGQIAKSLLEAGVPLSISSRAAGTVNEDKTVAIQQIYTYDLVAKPGFESAQLRTVNESANPKQKFINELVKQLNESSSTRKDHSINSKFGIINENISIIDVTDKFPSVPLREEAKQLIKNNTEIHMAETKPAMNEEAIQKWTELFTQELGVIKEELSKLKESAGETGELTKLKEYVEKIRKIQEDSLNWSSEIAKAVNEVATYADTLAEKSNKHYTLTKKIAETVDYNAQTLNSTQDWVTEVATVTNAIGETVDHNAEMLNGLNEWTTQIAKGVNALNEWNEEIAPAVNGMHEWTSSIAKNLNHSVNWTEDMFGRAISKEDAMKLVEYIELVAESKKNPELKSKIVEMLKTHSITAKPLNEAHLKGIAVIDTVSKVGNFKTEDLSSKNKGVAFDPKSGTIEATSHKASKLGTEKMPVGNDKLQMPKNPKPEKVGDPGCCNDPKGHQTGLKKTIVVPGTADKKVTGDGPTSKSVKDQNMKLNVKPDTKKGFTNEELNKKSDIQARKSILDEKLSKIAEALEKEKSIDEAVKKDFPFTQLLSESDRKRFAGLDATDKQKVAAEVQKVPTTDSKVISKLWENVLASKKVDEPLWLTLAPKIYKKAYDKLNDQLKENLKARAEFYTLNTQYQIDNFWETSGIIVKPSLTLNESVTAKTPEESEQKLDTFVASIGEAMKKYSV